MKSILNKGLIKIINWLQTIQIQLEQKVDTSLPYSSLSPTENAEGVNAYLEALDWAVENRKKLGIYNVALTGPYGSGKSSILKTYMATRKNRGLNFLPISLATFREEKHTETLDEPDSGKNELLRLIELSILQQIFYHEDDSNIPDSRFRKIKSFSKWKLSRLTLGLLIFTFSVIHLFFRGVLSKALHLNVNYFIAEIIHWVSLLIFITGIIIVIYKSIRVLSNISIEKLKIHNAEINIDKNISKSILNHHLDEILYFFQVTDYNIVIIEDLDRFRETDIFTKLREINLLINSSHKIKKEVLFIYAVRDDMFVEDNERTKFFEFIIPVIPVINPNNSSQKLLAKDQTHKYKLSENIIDSISIFIDDMRLLHNITNEFFLYRQLLNQTLEPDKLLALIVYKNLFPNDFAKLSNNKGDLFKVFTKHKKQLIINQIEEINKSIKIDRERISELEKVVLTDLKELRYAYIMLYVSKYPGFVSFVINGANISLQDMAIDENFQHLIKNECHYTYNLSYQYQYAQTQKVQLVFSKIDEEMNPERKYLDRERDLKDIYSGRVEELKKGIAEKVKKIDRIRRQNLRELVTNVKHVFEFENEKQSNIVNLLIRNGFIDENYHDYISIFYEGSITKSDQQFLINVKSQLDTPFDFTISKTENLIGKINPFDFEKRYVLNYKLLDTLFNKIKYANQLDSMTSALANESDFSARFIEGYLNNGQEPGMLIRHLAKKWKGFWNYIEVRSQYSTDRKKIYFRLLIEHAELSDIKSLYNEDIFRKSLYGYSDFLSIINNNERLKEIITLLNLKFTFLDQKESSAEMLEYIYQRNNYEINSEMLVLMLSFKNAYNNVNFNKQNYHAIRMSGCKELINYVNEFMEDYIKQVYLELPENNEEVETDLLLLLNEKSLSEELLAKIIAKTTTKISDLEKVSSIETKKLLMDHNKMASSWHNLFNFYQADGSTSIDTLVGFMEIKENINTLSKSKIPKDEGESKENTHFILKLLKCNIFSDINYNQMLQSIPYSFTSISIEDLNAAKVKGLVEQQKLSFNKTNFDDLKNQGQFHLLFLEKYKSRFFEKLNDFQLDAGDVMGLLCSVALTDGEKNALSEITEESLLIQKSGSLEEIGRLIIKNNGFRLTDTLLAAVLTTHGLNKEQRILIFKLKHTQVDTTSLEAFLNNLNEPYSEITIRGKRPLLPFTNYNETLAEILKAKNYISSYDKKDNGIRINTFQP